MRLGVLDIGSNTVHLLLVDAHPGARPVPFATHKRPLSLVAFLDREGNITARGAQELESFVAEAREFALGHNAEDLLAFCTSAIREASNGADVLEQVRESTGVVLRELTGPQEAAMTYLAVRRWYGWGAGSILDLDIGGGSFELAMGMDEIPSVATSVPLGAGRLTRDWLEGDPPTAKSIKALKKYIKVTMNDVADEFLALGKPDLVAGSSKTFRSLARLAGSAPSGSGPFVRRTLRREDLELWTTRLAAMTADDTAHLDGVSQLRAPQLLAGALVAGRAMKAMKVKTIEICPWALREGLILRRFDTLMYESSEPLLMAGGGFPELTAGTQSLTEHEGRTR